MAYEDLRSFLKALEKEGELRRVRAEVDPYLEVGEITDRVQKSRAHGRPGPALLFENVKGSRLPLAMNVFQYFRAQAGLSRADTRTEEVYRRLDEDAPELSHWWGCHSVAELTARRVTVDPVGGPGPIRLTLSSFRPVDDPSALVLLFTPLAEEDRRRLADLTQHPLRAVGPCDADRQAG